MEKITSNIHALDSQSEFSPGRSMRPPPLQLEANPEFPSDKSEEDFDPKIGTEVTSIDGTFGKFEVTHGLTKKPSRRAFGKYDLKIEMEPNDKCGESEVGFIQVSRQGLEGGGWATKADDKYMSEDKALRTEQEEGWRVDRANHKRDKTPFYGMYKNDEGEVKQYRTARVGKFGGDKAMLVDRPDVAYIDHMQFTASALDMKVGTEFGAISWGYKYDETKKVYEEEKPKLQESGSERMKGRDRAVGVWNKDVAKDDIDVVPVPD